MDFTIACLLRKYNYIHLIYFVLIICLINYCYKAKPSYYQTINSK